MVESVCAWDFRCIQARVVNIDSSIPNRSIAPNIGHFFRNNILVCRNRRHTLNRHTDQHIIQRNNRHRRHLLDVDLCRLDILDSVRIAFVLVLVEDNIPGAVDRNLADSSAVPVAGMRFADTAAAGYCSNRLMPFLISVSCYFYEAIR